MDDLVISVFTSLVGYEPGYDGNYRELHRVVRRRGVMHHEWVARFYPMDDRVGWVERDQQAMLGWIAAHGARLATKEDLK